MKKIIGGVGLLATTGLLCYPGFGFLVEKGLRQQIEAVPKQYGMTIELRDFKRRWFSSDAKLYWRWFVPAHLTQNQAGQTITVSPQQYEKEFDIKIYHGPLIIHDNKPFLGVGFAETTLNWPILNNGPKKEEFDSKSVFPMIKLSMAFNFLLQNHWTTSIPAFDLIGKNNQDEIKWKGLELKNQADRYLSEFDGKVNFAGITLHKLGMSFDIDNFKTNYGLKQDQSGVFTGHVNVDLKNMGSMGIPEHEWHVNNFMLRATSNVEQEHFSTNAIARLEGLDLNKEHQGPFELDMNVSKVNAKTLAKLHQSLQQNQSASPSFRSRGMLAIIASLPELLKYGLEIDIKKLDLNLSKGQLFVNMNLSLPADNGSSSLWNLQRLESLEGDMNLKMSQSLFKDWVLEVLNRQLAASDLSLDKMQDTQDIKIVAQKRSNDKIAALTSQGVLKVEATDYLMHIKLHQGQWTINDLPFDPTWLMF